jgi:hypothetical protein
MTYYENINHETVEGFEIYLDATPEDNKPDWKMTDDERVELFRQIDSGSTAWFVARVRAVKNNVKLAESYLGGCCYKSAHEFIEGDYYPGMVQEFIAESRKMIASLVE